MFSLWSPIFNLFTWLTFSYRKSARLLLCAVGEGVACSLCSVVSVCTGGLTELLDEQKRARLALRRGLDGTSRPEVSPVPMLRVTGRVLVVGLAASGSGRSTGLEESQLRVREKMGPGLLSAWGRGDDNGNTPMFLVTMVRRSISRSMWKYFRV